MAATPLPPNPLGHQRCDETLPYGMLKDHVSEDNGFIMRTRSLDETSQHGTEKVQSGDHAETSDASARGMAALHASFEAAVFRNRRDSPSSHFSDDDDDDCAEDYGEISGKKHMRPHTNLETLEVNPPGTVRKQPRTRAVTISKTPARPKSRPPGAMKKTASTTPSSAAKRRKAHWQLNDASITRVPPTTPFHAHVGSPPTTTIKLDGSIFGKGMNGSAFAPSPPPALTPKRNSDAFGTAKSMSKWHNTGTTAASTMAETTVESSDSVDTSSPTTTRFRFTSFPASLPRVNNPRAGRDCPDSVRKRMSFGEPASSYDANQSRDDDGTQNTSISSLSAEGHHQHLAPAPGVLPPTILDLHPPVVEKDSGSTRPIHAKLFGDDEDFGYSDDDDDETESSPVADMVGRTRLNFNTVLSPPKDGLKTKVTIDGSSDLSNTYDQRRINSFPSSLSSHTHINNLSCCELIGASLTPPRSSESNIHTRTPKEVQIHFPFEDECSPIPGFNLECARVELHDPMPTTSEDLKLTKNPSLVRRPRSTTSMAPTSDNSTKSESKTKEAMSTGSESRSGKSRRLRPMPDMSAFESHAMSSKGDRSTDDSATLDSKGLPPAQRLTCPPTPVRTPAWANEAGGHTAFGRQSSLITTKVLLSVSSEVVEGRCSLENSVLDDDSKTNICRLTKYPPAKGKSDSDGAVLEKVNASKLPGNGSTAPESAAKIPRLQAPPRLMRRVPAGQEVESVISFSNDFEILRLLGSGAFADVYKVRSVQDNRLYAVKRNRRQFRGKRDRDMALSEVQAMQQLQSVYAEPSVHSSELAGKNSYCLYLLFFFRAWQEDGYFLCQTELCCRDTCRELLDNVKFFWNSAKDKYPSLRRHLLVPSCTEEEPMEDVVGRSVPNKTVWKICHDIAAGLSHIHSHGLVHHDIKPSNVFFVSHPRFGAMCKIGDFGMAGRIGSSADGLEGDTRYLPAELLESGTRHPSADIFSLGLTIFEVATDLQAEMPSDGPNWHFLRSAEGPNLPKEQDNELLKLIQLMTDPNETRRPTADSILQSKRVVAAGLGCDEFLRDYIQDIEAFDRMEEEAAAMDCNEEQTPRNGSHRTVLQARSPGLSMLMSNPPNLFSPVGKCTH